VQVGCTINYARKDAGKKLEIPKINEARRTSERVDKAGHQFTAFHLSPCDREMSSAEYCRDGETLQVAETGGCGSPAPVRKSSFVLQENGELWRAAPFSAVPTAFPVKVGNRSYYGNCIWDALGIPAMLGQNARIDASCGCCNLQMLLKVENGRLLGSKGLIHIAVPARDWYKDIVFT